MTEAKQQMNLGVIEIDEVILKHEPFTSLFSKLLDATNTQGMLRGNGTFAELHDQLLLPESYVISAVKQERFGHLWWIAVYSPDIPLPNYTDPFHDHIGISLSYSYDLNPEYGTRTLHPPTITFYPRRTA